MNLEPLSVIDSHTAGEPTRCVVSSLDALDGLTAIERRDHLRSDMDWIRKSLILEPRGSDVIVGAVLGPSVRDECIASVVFFNNVGYLGMCGHGLIGIIETLASMNRISPGEHPIETPVGVVAAKLHEDGRVSFDNVPSYRFACGVSVDVPEYGIVTGDVAWGGNWFFLSDDIEEPISWSQTDRMLQFATAVRQAAEAAGVTGKDGALIDHYEFFRPSSAEGIDADNFVLCPGRAFDRSPCGTGTSAKLACLEADGKLAEGELWRQRSVTGGVFEGQYRSHPDGIIPTITGKAYVNARIEILFDANDPLRFGYAG